MKNEVPDSDIILETSTDPTYTDCSDIYRLLQRILMVLIFTDCSIMQFKTQNFPKHNSENTKMCCIYKGLYYNNYISGYVFMVVC